MLGLAHPAERTRIIIIRGATNGFNLVVIITHLRLSSGLIRTYITTKYVRLDWVISFIHLLGIYVN